MMNLSIDQFVSFFGVLTSRQDPYSNSHSKNVATLVLALAGKANYPETKMENLRISALLHDVGKLLLSESTLNKIGRLTVEEIETIHRHTVIGYDAVRVLGLDPVVARAILEHHENWDGTGYPNGLKGEQICIEARMIRICDSFDSLTSRHSYRQALVYEEAVRILDNDRKLFDPILLEIFIRQVLKD